MEVGRRDGHRVVSRREVGESVEMLAASARWFQVLADMVAMGEGDTPWPSRSPLPVGLSNAALATVLESTDTALGYALERTEGPSERRLDTCGRGWAIESQIALRGAVSSGLHVFACSRVIESSSVACVRERLATAVAAEPGRGGPADRVELVVTPTAEPEFQAPEKRLCADVFRR